MLLALPEWWLIFTAWLLVVAGSASLLAVVTCVCWWCLDYILRRLGLGVELSIAAFQRQKAIKAATGKYSWWFRRFRP